MRETMNQVNIAFKPRPDSIRDIAMQHRAWLEQQLGVSLDQCVMIESHEELVEVGASCVLGCRQFQDNTSPSVRRLQSMVEKASIPPAIMPRVYFNTVTQARSHRSLREALDARELPISHERAVLSWQDYPIALHIKGMNWPIVAWTISYIGGPADVGNENAYVLIVRKEMVAQATDLLSDLMRPVRVPSLITLHGGQQKVSRCDWDDMVLDPDVSALLKDDVEFFFESADWFQKMKLPHRRGYLLHGPPGNGKSTAVRCLLSAYGLTAYTLRLFDKDTEDSTLDSLFETARKKSPCVVLLEDLDRAFPRTGERKTQISIQHLLNTLDGIASGEGMIVVATANEPTLLDPAILRRPGRFDRVVYFPNPSAELRRRFYGRYRLTITEAELKEVAATSDGFSFAQLRETFILAGQRAFARRGDIDGNDLLYGVNALRKANQHGSRPSKLAGFEAQLATMLD